MSFYAKKKYPEKKERSIKFSLPKDTRLKRNVQPKINYYKNPTINRMLQVREREREEKC